MQELKNTLNFISRCLMLILDVCCKVQRSEDTKQLRYKWDIEFFMNELYDQLTQTNHVSKTYLNIMTNLSRIWTWRSSSERRWTLNHVELISTHPPTWGRWRHALSVQLPILAIFPLLEKLRLYTTVIQVEHTKRWALTFGLVEGLILDPKYILYNWFYPSSGVLSQTISTLLLTTIR